MKHNTISLTANWILWPAQPNRSTEFTLSISSVNLSINPLSTGSNFNKLLPLGTTIVILSSIELTFKSKLDESVDWDDSLNLHATKPKIY